MPGAFRSGGAFGYSIAIMNRQPNPQGKGLTPVLDSLTRSRAQRALPAKRVDQISSELFTSLFVLHSDFSFKPVPGRRYCLYRKADRFRLSLIAPQEWGDARFGQYIGECVLQPDLTWTLRFDERAARDGHVRDRDAERPPADLPDQDQPGSRDRRDAQEVSP
jgi:hypothetical protein